ncbi:MAG: hypothetical protein ACRETT_12530 [Steroidobacteraceae bacterium]
MLTVSTPVTNNIDAVNIDGDPTEREFPVKSYIALVPLILAATAAISEPSLADGQAQASALLSRPVTFGERTLGGPAGGRFVAEPVTDGHAKAAALLSRPNTKANATVSVALLAGASDANDGQAAAAALLSRARTM